MVVKEEEPEEEDTYLVVLEEANRRQYEEPALQEEARLPAWPRAGTGRLSGLRGGQSAAATTTTRV